jgi:hypothetical protein
MSTLYKFNNLTEVAKEFRKDLTGDDRKERDIILLYAHNGTGKTRLSMEFKNLGKPEKIEETEESKLLINGDTLYFNAFTEDLFIWNNDLEDDVERYIYFNQDSVFVNNIVQSIDLDVRIKTFLNNYTDIDFDFDFDNFKIIFNKTHGKDSKDQVRNIKISRGEENLFIWCFYLVICQLVIDGMEGFESIKYIYIDDPISSLR